MKQVQARGEAIARAAQERRIGRIARKLREQLGGVRVTEEAAAVTIEGTRLIRRWLVEPALRFVGKPNS